MKVLIYAVSLVCFLSISSWAADGVITIGNRTFLETDPISPQSPRPGHEQLLTVNVRMIFDGVKPDKQTVDTLVADIESTYSQCDGIYFHVNVVSVLNGPKTRFQDNMVDVKGDRLEITDDYVKMFEPWVASRPAKTIDIHFVDYLTSSAREQAAKHDDINDMFYGKTFVADGLDSVYLDGRSNGKRGRTMVELGGDTVVIALGTLQYAQTRKFIYPGNPRVEVLRSESSVLAHEMGHILFETPDHGTDQHFCPKDKTKCPDTNLMHEGGYPNPMVLAPPQFEKPMAFTPLPGLEKEQCELLMHHPLVTRD